MSNKYAVLQAQSANDDGDGLKLALFELEHSGKLWAGDGEKIAEDTAEDLRCVLPLHPPSSPSAVCATNDGPCRMTVGAMLQERYDEISNEMKSHAAPEHKTDRESKKAPEHRADRESMSMPDYLHAAIPLLCPVPDKDGRYREGRNSEATRWSTSAVAGAPPSAVAPATVPGGDGGKGGFVPGKFVPEMFVPLPLIVVYSVFHIV